MSAGAAIGAGLGAQVLGGILQGGANADAQQDQRQFLRREAGSRRRGPLGQQIFGLLGLGPQGGQSPQQLAAGITDTRRQGAAAGNEATRQAVMNRLGLSRASGGRRAGIEGQLAGQAIQNIANVDSGEAQLAEQFRQQQLGQALNATQVLNPIAGQAGMALGQSLGTPQNQFGAGLAGLGGSVAGLGVLGAQGQLDFGNGVLGSGGGSSFIRPDQLQIGGGRR